MVDYLAAKRAIMKDKLKKSGFDEKPKKCVTCSELKSRTEFALHDTSSDGRASVCNQCRNDANNERRRTNPVHRLKHHMAVRVEKQLGIHCPIGYQRDLEQYLGYRIQQLVDKLEEDLKKEGMTLARAFKADWHLDHIVPLHSFNVTHIVSQSFQDCWAMHNLKMIPSEVNLAKGGKIISHAEARIRVESTKR